MKKLFILSMAAFLVFGFTSGASAEWAAYYAVNGNQPSTVNIGLNAITVGGGTLFYDIIGDENGWLPVGSGFTVPLVSDKKLVVIGLQTEPGIYDTNTTQPLNWLWPKYDDPNLFRYVQMTFAGGTTTFQIASDPNYVSPVPLPSALWLLGAGLVGLVGVRRKIQR